MHFGEHFTLDGYGGLQAKLDDRDLVLGVVKELPEIMGMHTLSEPQIFRAEGNGLKDPGGWSAFVVIQESHISIHTFPARRFLSADVYTCKNGLDKKMVSDYLIRVFELNDVEQNFIYRGTRYPKTDLT